MGQWALGTTGYKKPLKHLLPFLFFLGNWSLAFQGPSVNFEIGILWSVCVEEQFYIFDALIVAGCDRFRTASWSL